MQAVVMTTSPPLPDPLQITALSAPPQGMPAATSARACLRLNAQVGEAMTTPRCILNAAIPVPMELFLKG